MLLTEPTSSPARAQPEPPIRRPKLAEQVARRIEDRILAEGWTVGQPLGREADLAAQEGVSRWTFREALRLLEQDGLVVSRRGSGGGLFVAAPMVDVISNGLANYLEFTRVDAAEIIGIQRALEAAMIDRAADRLDAAARRLLGQLVAATADPRRAEAFDATFRIRLAILACADQPAITLFVRAFSRMQANATAHSAFDDATYFGLLDDIVTAGAGMALALCEGSRARALEADRAYLDAGERMLRGSFAAGQQPIRPGAVERAFRLYPAIRPQKKPERLAWEIGELIIEKGWPIGWKIGSEAELMAQFKVGRSVLREGIRTLERLGVVEMGRGSASGLTVISPDPARIVAACRRHLRRAGLTAEAAAEARALVASAAGSGPSGAVVSLLLSVLSPGC
jgi:DNA-binding FadR family transcriptional regulator